MKKRIVFTVTGDLVYDQRMQRICHSLAKNNYEVILLGFKKNKPLKPLSHQSFTQIRLPLFFRSGLLFFTEANLRIFFYFLFKRFDAICAIDLDTIIPVYFLSILKNKKRIYDAHELFCETHDLALKPRRRKIWKGIERIFMPKFKIGYTVNKSVAAEYRKMYNLNFAIIRNLPEKQNITNSIDIEKTKTILYQGVLSAGRGIEYFIPAMKNIDAKLIICGNGDYFDLAEKLIDKENLTDKILVKGFVLPNELKQITASACIGLNTIANKGKSYYLSLSNRTFDYMNAGIPQIAMNYPEYAAINDEFEIAILLDSLSEENITVAVNKLLHEESLYNRLKANCFKAKEVFNWENEEKKLIAFYNALLH